VLAASFLLGHAGRESRPVLVVGAMHALVILLTAGGTPSRGSAFAAAVTVLGWMLLNTLWRSPAPLRID